MQKRNELFFIMILAACSAWLAASPPPNLSLRGVAEWVEIGGHISSGTGTLPAVASSGARYTDLSIATAPVEYRSNGAAWVPISSSGSGSGVSTHSALAGLDFAGSGHTGFASASGLTAAESTISGHIASQTDPHGASMTISDAIQLGTGTPDAFIERTATGTVMISSYTVFPSETATPTTPATGTMWMDGNLVPPKMKVWDGTSWNALW